MHIFDLETNGLYHEVTKVHCLSIYDTSKDLLHLFDPQSRPIEEGIEMLRKSPLICGHNIIGYDLPVIRKLFPGFDFGGEVHDTLVISRVQYPDIKAGDYGRFRQGKLPGQLIGSYSLESWGYRIGELLNIISDIEYISADIS